jgi:16S rRNA (cytidine1402-2'-O)-methyltransferase
LPDSARKAGTLFVVATPIGNLADMTFRAVETLSTVDLIAAEDTRHSRHLLARYSISTPSIAYHEHNERQQTGKLMDSMLSGKSVALISDAGTPLISDPGFTLIQAALDRDIHVVPIPGCCAAIAALSVSGLPVDRFVFEGFLPARGAARRRKLEDLVEENRTMIFYESAHRIEASLSDMVQVFGPDRQAVLAREITKQFETIVNAELSRLVNFVVEDANQKKGEFVVLVHGGENRKNVELLSVLGPLMQTLPLKQAVGLTVEITGYGKNEVYTEALKLKG